MYKVTSLKSIKEFQKAFEEYDCGDYISLPEKSTPTTGDKKGIEMKTYRIIHVIPKGYAIKDDNGMIRHCTNFDWKLRPATPVEIAKYKARVGW